MSRAYQSFFFDRFIHSLLVLLFSVAVSSVQAASLVTSSTTQVASLSEDDPISRILVVDEQAVAIGAKNSWVLNKNEQRWERNGWRPPSDILGVASDGVQTFLLLGFKHAGQLTRIERLFLRGSTLGSSSFPPLPVRLVSAQGAVLDDKLMVAGTTAFGVSQLFGIDLAAEQAHWVAYEAWPGRAGNVSSVVAQNSFLLVTVAESVTAVERLLQWHPDQGWRERNQPPGMVIGGTGRAVGQGHVLYLIAGLPNSDVKAQLMSFHTITGSWASHGQVQTTEIRFGVGWKDGILWVQAGEQGSGTAFALTELESGKASPAMLDWAVIAVYLLGMLGIGFYFYTRDAQKSEAEFFLGGRSIPFWAAGISLYVSNASSISYIAIPAKAFSTNWQYLLGNLINGIAIMFVAVWIIPLLRRLDLMSIFHYLETRFHPWVRTLSSALFIVGQLAGRMTIILFLPSLAISAVTGFDIASSIIVMGIVTIVYTVLGGMKAVIWTDFLQLFVMFGGTILTLVYIMMSLDGGTAEFLTISMSENKMKLVDWSFDPSQATVWVLMFVVLFDTVLTFPKDQVLMQRVLSTKSAKQASRSVWVYAIIVLPASVMFYLVGTALYVFYQSHPERMDPTLSIDATFPLFIAAELPVGITGLLIAGIFSASMSTLSSILNSVATVATVDFYEKIVRIPLPKKSLRFAKITTVVAGVIGVSLALVLSRYKINSVLDLALEIWGLVGGGFAGAYTLGMFTRRANWQGVLIGVATSIIITLWVWSLDMLHPFFYLPVAIMVCIVAGYLSSWLFPAPTSLKGLTIYKQDTVKSSNDI
jgi:SSS family transporter